MKLKKYDEILNVIGAMSSKMSVVENFSSTIQCLVEKMDRLSSCVTALSNQVKPFPIPSFSSVFANDDSCASPARKLPHSTSPMPSVPNHASINTTNLASEKESRDECSIVLKLNNENSDSNIAALKHLDSDNLLSSKFSTKMSQDGSVNLLC